MTADPKGIDPGDYKKWLREAISLATRHAWLWMLVMLAGALLWYVVKPYPFLPSFVFTATVVGLVIVAYLVDHSHLDINRGRKPLVALLEEQRDGASDARIRRMRESQIETAKRPARPWQLPTCLLPPRYLNL
jgi:hypothetical protein